MSPSSSAFYGIIDLYLYDTGALFTPRAVNLAAQLHPATQGVNANTSFTKPSGVAGRVCTPDVAPHHVHSLTLNSRPRCRLPTGTQDTDLWSHCSLTYTTWYMNDASLVTCLGV